MGNKTVFEARWKVKLSLEKPSLESASDPLIAYAMAPGECTIEAVSTIHFNDDRQVDYVQIDKWVVTGELLDNWPDEQLSNDQEQMLREERAVFMKKTRDWAMDLREMPLGAGPEADKKLVKAASNLVAKFVNAEIKYVATAAAQAAVLSSAADTLSYAIQGSAIDAPHVQAMGVTGVFSGIVNALWLQELERKVPGTNFTSVLKKTVADFFIASSVFSSGRLVLIAILCSAFGGAPPGPGYGWTMVKFLSTMKLELSTFTPYNLLAFRFIPPKLRPFASATLAAVYTVILAGISRSGVTGR